MKSKILVLGNGERHPILLGDDGLPLFYPNVYEASMRRQVNLASATIAADLTAIKILYYWARHRHIDLERRFHQGEFLTLDELDSLAETLRYKCLHYMKDAPPAFPAQKPKRIASVETYRLREPQKMSTLVDSDTTARRLYVISQYLDWLAQKRTTWVSMRSSDYEKFEISRRTMVERIKARIPSSKRNEDLIPKGLSKQVQNLLLEILDPTSPRNPFKNRFTRFRNQLLIHLLLKLGSRRGEILLVRIHRDVDISSNILSIPRNPDDRDDPRRDEPNTKTQPRELPLDENLVKLLLEYITKVRNTIKGARSHDFLMVAAKSGRPMSKAAVTKIFITLRKVIPELPSNFTAHTLRHTWNGNFSYECDRSKMPEEVEKQTRNYLMGWKKTSRMAEVYTQRFVRAKATDVSLKLQKMLCNRKTNELDTAD